MARKQKQRWGNKNHRNFGGFVGWNKGIFTQKKKSEACPPARLTIERKTFYFKRLSDGWSFRISEEGKLYSEIILELGILRWCRDALVAVLNHRGGGPFFRKWRSQDAVFLFQALSNSKGNFCILSKEPFRGRKFSIFIPEGKNGLGWKDFLQELNRFFPGTVGCGSPSPPPKSEEQRWKPVEEVSKALSEDASEPGLQMKLAFKPENTIIVRRLRVTDDWWIIRKSLEEMFKVMINLRPCCGNLAVGFCASMQEAVSVCNKKFVSLGDIQVEVQWWDPEFLLDKQKLAFSGGWVEILGIPPQLRTEEVISKIALFCGGLVEEEDIRGIWCLNENIRVKVKGSEDGFIPVGSSISQGGVYFPLRFLICDKGLEEDVSSEASAHLSVDSDIELEVDDSKNSKALSTDKNQDLVEACSNEFQQDTSYLKENFDVRTGEKLGSGLEEKGGPVLSSCCNFSEKRQSVPSVAFTSGDEKRIEAVASLPVFSGCVAENSLKDREVKLIDVNLETQFDISSHGYSESDFEGSSDHDIEAKSFVSTPERSFQSYEDLDLFLGCSPTHIASLDTASHGRSSNLESSDKVEYSLTRPIVVHAGEEQEAVFIESLSSSMEVKTEMLDRVQRFATNSVPSFFSLEEMAGGSKIMMNGCSDGSHIVRCDDSGAELDLLQEKDLPEVVIMHWACSKITASPTIPDANLLEILLDKLKLCKGISYAAVAGHADKIGRRKLAALLVEHEPRSSKQVPLLLSIGEEDTALAKAIESGDTDLVYLVLFHIWQKRQPLEFFGMIQAKILARDLFITYARCYKHEFLKDFFLSTGQLHEVAFLLWKESWELGKNPMASKGSPLHGPRIKLIDKAHSLFAETKEHVFESKAAEEHAKLLKIQHDLEVSTKQAIFVDSSISDTIRTCIVLGNHRAALKVKTEFKVSEKRWYWLKVFALATTRDWIALEKFSKEKRPPIGYKPFVEACIDADEKAEALKYIPKLADPREKAESYARIGMAKEAADAASQAKDGELLGRLKLSFAQNTAASSIFDTLRDRLSFPGVS